MKVEREEAALTLLKLYEPLANGKQVWLIIKDTVYLDHGHDDPRDKSYYYAEHTCPTNYLDVEMIADGDDEDPHGIFTWVRTIPLPVEYEDDNARCNVDYKLLFPEMVNGAVIDGELARKMIA